MTSEHPSSVPPDDIRRARLAWLDDAAVAVSGGGPLQSRDDQDPGMIDVTASVVLRVWPDDEHAWDGNGEPPTKEVLAERLAAEGTCHRAWPTPDGDTVQGTILEAEGFVLDTDLLRGSVLDVLDAHSQERADFLPALCGEDGFLAEGIGDDVWCDRALVLTEVRLAPAWRRLGGVGAWLAAEVIGRLAVRTDTVLLKPWPLGAGPGEPGFGAALGRVERVWASAGFRLWDHGIWWAHAEAVALLRHGLASSARA
jgi:hypothetical protein